MTGSGDFQIARAPDMAASTEISGRKTGVPCLRNTDFPVCAPSGVRLRCAAKKSGQDVRLAHRPQACVPNFAMPPGAADAADDADGSGQRDNPWSLYGGHGESGHVPDFLHFCRAGVPACRLN